MIDSWNLEPALLIMLPAQVLGYLLCIGPLRRFFPGATPVTPLRQQSFLFGMAILFIALVSPIDTYAGYLFSAHMVQHLLLALVVPPFLLAGIPGWLLAPLWRVPLALSLARWLTRPLVAFLLFNVVFIGWHVPALYDLALREQRVHIYEHLTILFSALLTWWPIFGNASELPRAHPLLQTAYLFLQSLPSTILGALISFATDPLYPHYTTVPRLWGIGLMEDQQAAGLIMWIPGSLVFFAVMAVVFVSWLNRGDRVAS